jgi:hypothetical protein
MDKAGTSVGSEVFPVEDCGGYNARFMAIVNGLVGRIEDVLGTMESSTLP